MSRQGTEVKESDPNTVSAKKFSSAHAGSGSLAVPPRQKLEGAGAVCCSVRCRASRKAAAWMNFPSAIG